MTFDHPAALGLLALLAPLALLGRLSYLRGRQDLLRLAGAWQADRLPGEFFLKSLFSFLLFGLFVIGAVLALAGPRWGRVAVEEERSGREVVLVIDVSNSMLAADVAPSRLERSRAAGRWLLDHLPGTRFALVAFKGRAVRLLPLTEDTLAVASFLDEVNGRWIAAAGTDVEQGIAQALASLTPGAGREQAVVLFTDGESLAGNPAREAVRAREAGVRLLVAAAGTAGGAEVPDGSGKPVHTRLQLEPLQRIADLSGGRVLPLDERAGPALAEALGGWDRGTAPAPGIVLIRPERYRLPLVLGLVFLALSLAVRAARLGSGL